MEPDSTNGALHLDVLVWQQLRGPSRPGIAPRTPASAMSHVADGSLGGPEPPARRP